MRKDEELRHNSSRFHLTIPCFVSSHDRITHELTLSFFVTDQSSRLFSRSSVKRINVFHGRRSWSVDSQSLLSLFLCLLFISSWFRRRGRHSPEYNLSQRMCDGRDGEESEAACHPRILIFWENNKNVYEAVRESVFHGNNVFRSQPSSS